MRRFLQTWNFAFLLLATPPIVWAVVALHQGFALEGDNASIALRTFDVFSSTPPLLGMPSTSGLDAPGIEAFHPGPLQFILMAPMYALSGWNTWGIMAGALFVNLGLLAIGLRVAWAIGSPYVIRAVFTAMLVVVYLQQSHLYRPWNTYPVAMGVVPLVVLAWGIAVGKRWMWPWFVLVGSVVAQAHLFGLPIMLIVCCGLWLVSTRTKRPIRPARSELLVTLLVALVCWALPIADVILNVPGNLGEILAYLTADRQVSGESQSMGMWIVWLAVFAVSGVIGGRRGWNALKRKAPVSENEFIHSAGYLLLAVVALGIVGVSLIGGVNRQGYLAMAEGIAFLAVAALWVRKTYWWTRFSTVSLVVLALFTWGTYNQIEAKNAGFQRDGSTTAVVEAAQSMVSDFEGEPIALTETGLRSWMNFSSAVRLALILDGYDIHFNHPGRPDEYDRQRRINEIDGDYVVLRLDDMASDGTFPALDEHDVLDQQIVSVQGDPEKVRLALISTSE